MYNSAEFCTFTSLTPRRPLIQAQFARLFFCPHINKLRYTKAPCRSEEHVRIMVARGLEISDPQRALGYLERIGYYRLSGYMYHLQESDGSHRFKTDVTFNHIIEHYKFDNKLRLLTLSYLERIEVALRARLTDEYSNEYQNFFWYTFEDKYANINVRESILQEVQDRFNDQSELFLKKYASKYTEERFPPSNMALELLSFGKMTKLYEGLKNDQGKQSIASYFGLPSALLSSWLKYLSGVRNICAHHGRLWNRGITANRPILPNREKYKFVGSMNDRFDTSYYGAAAIIDRLLRSFNDQNTFIAKLVTLIDEHPLVNPLNMSFPPDWRENAVWIA